MTEKGVGPGFESQPAHQPIHCGGGRFCSGVVLFPFVKGATKYLVAPSFLLFYLGIF